MTKSIKTILTEFESYNHSSIQPLPPIAKGNGQPGPHWTLAPPTQIKEEEVISIEQQVEAEIKLITDGCYELGIDKRPKKKRLDVVSPRKPFNTYLHSEVPITSGTPIIDPIFSLSKRDAHRAQVDIHNTFVKNDTAWNPRKDQNDKLISENDCLSNSKLRLLDPSVVSEIDRYPQHHTLLSKIYSEYKTYIEHLEVKRQASTLSMPTQLDHDSNEIIEALSRLESTQHVAMEEISKVNNTVVEEPETVTKIVNEDVDPSYHSSTQSTIALARTLQDKMDHAAQLTEDIKSYRKWNPLLEQDLLLDEKDLREYIRNVKRANRQLSDSPNLKSLYDEIQAQMQS